MTMIIGPQGDGILQTRLQSGYVQCYSDYSFSVDSFEISFSLQGICEDCRSVRVRSLRQTPHLLRRAVSYFHSWGA